MIAIEKELGATNGDRNAPRPFDFAVKSRILTLAAHDHTLSRTDLAVLANIVGRAKGDTGLSYPPARTIANDIVASERQVRRSIETLRARGWIQVLPGARGRANRYRVCAEAQRHQELMTRLDPGLIPVTRDTRDRKDPGPMTPASGTHDTGVRGPMTPASPEPIRSKPVDQPNTAPPSAAVDALPGWLPMEAWTAFVQMRAETRRRVTKTAAMALVAELDRLRGDGHDPAAVLDQSTRAGYPDLYPIKSAQRAPQDDGAPPRRKEFTAT